LTITLEDGDLTIKGYRNFEMLKYFSIALELLKVHDVTTNYVKNIILYGGKWYAYAAVNYYCIGIFIKSQLDNTFYSGIIENME
jgi:hypothetical protein